MSLSIGQVADLAGISARMLRHYDKLGLLRPSHVNDNGYRWYERDQLFRLQRILLFRDYGLPLAAIKDMLSRNNPAGERDVLLAHRALVAQERERLTKLLSTLDLTLDEIAGGGPIGERDFFDGLRASRSVLRSELRDRFGPAVDAAFDSEESHTAEWNEQDYEAAAQRGNDVYEKLAHAMNRGHSPQSPEAASLVQVHYDLISESWIPGKDAYKGLADLYVEPGSHRDSLVETDANLPEWLAVAMRVFADDRL